MLKRLAIFLIGAFLASAVVVWFLDHLPFWMDPDWWLGDGTKGSGRLRDG